MKRGDWVHLFVLILILMMVLAWCYASSKEKKEEVSYNFELTEYELVMSEQDETLEAAKSSVIDCMIKRISGIPEPSQTYTYSEIMALKFTEGEKELLARVIMSEASTLSLEGKRAVLATIMNRVKSDKFPNSIEEVCLASNQYSTADNGDPNEDCYAVIEEYVDGVFPSDMYYFRTDYPHDFGYAYMRIGNTYFSTESLYDGD